MSSIHCKKEQLIIDFFDIGGIPELQIKINKLKEHREKLKIFFFENNDIEIENLISVVDALIIYMSEDDKEKARQKVSHLWDNWSKQYTLNLYDIRILTAILFTSDTLENCINNTLNALNQLEKYNKHEKYIIIKTSLYYNLSYYLMEAKRLLNKEDIKLINTDLDKLLIETLDILIDLSIKYNNYIFPKAILRKGVLTKDKGLVYCGLMLINNTKSKEKLEFIKENDVFSISYKDLL